MHPQRIAVVALLLSGLTGAALLALPMYNNGATLFQVNGASTTLRGLAIPVLLSALGLAGRNGRTAAAVCVSIFVVIAGGSVGLFYAPSALALVWAAALDRAQ